MDFELRRPHARRLREVYRSAGWPYLDAVEVELLAAGLLERISDGAGPETVRVTEAGMRYTAQASQSQRRCFSAHERLVEKVALAMQHEGRIVWRGLKLRAWVAPDDGSAAAQGAGRCVCPMSSRYATPAHRIIWNR